MSGRAAIIGLGDLGCRIARRLASHVACRELVLAGRRLRDPWLRQVASSPGGPRIRFRPLDAGCAAAVERFLREEQPDVLVQCASLLSPFAVKSRNDRVGQLLSTAGFAAQLPAQVPLLAIVMRAVRTAGYDMPVVNCSYPDATHPLLATQGLAPTIGAGNVGMIELRVRKNLRRHAAVRVVAHHSQVRTVMGGEMPEDAGDRPWVFLDDGARADELAYAGARMTSPQELNEASAASAVEIVVALLATGSETRLSAPGPLGLPGGYPIVIRNARVELDLPSGTTLESVVAQQQIWAEADGIASIADDGALTMTKPARAALAAIDRALAEPITLDNMCERWHRLRAALDLS
jgi:hypothetical protein